MVLCFTVTDTAWPRVGVLRRMEVDRQLKQDCDGEARLMAYSTLKLNRVLEYT